MSDEVHQVSLPDSLPAVVMYVLRTYINGIEVDKTTALAAYAAFTEVCGRGDITLEDLQMGFGDEHPNHLAQGLSEPNSVPKVEEICAYNDADIRAYIGDNVANAVKVAHVIAGAQADAAITEDLGFLKPVSESQDKGELDALHARLRAYIQLKPWTQFRGQSYSLDKHKAFVPRDDEGNLKQGYAEMRKEDYVRPLIAYARTGDGEAYVSRHWGRAVGAAYKSFNPAYTPGQGPNREENWEGLTRFPKMAGHSPEDDRAWVKAHSPEVPDDF